MGKPRTSTLNVDGASLYYEIQGDGPVLVLMPGGPADGKVFAAIAPILAAHYTVVTYDPRGVSRSTVHREPEDARIIETLADDAARLIEAAGGGPAFLLGNSGGAVVGLDLAARHPERVRILVAHEPPCAALQPEPGRHLQATQDVVDIYRREGIGPGMQKFMEMVGVRGSAPRPASGGGAGGASGGPPSGAAQQKPAEPQSPAAQEAAREAAAQGQRTAEFFLKHVILGIAAYQPSIQVLKAGAPRIIAGVGADSKGQVAHQGGLELARRLGHQAVTFPGGHGGFISHAAEFAKVLIATLGS